MTFIFFTFIIEIFLTGCMGDTQFHFRIRQCPGRKSVMRAHSVYNKDCPVSLQVGRFTNFNLLL